MLVLLVCISGVLIITILFLHVSGILHIRATTIYMQAPQMRVDGVCERIALNTTTNNRKFIKLENKSRSLAYKNSPIKISGSFFDDSDMQSRYYLVVVYNKKDNIPLLTARYYFDKVAIEKSIRGASGGEDVQPKLTEFADGKIFLSDRLSGNTASKTYRKFRNYIFLLFYSEIMKYNRGCSYILMARKQKQDKLLKKYTGLGLWVVGSAVHHDHDHWVLLGDVEKSYEVLESTYFSKKIMKVREALHKINHKSKGHVH